MEDLYKMSVELNVIFSNLSENLTAKIPEKIKNLISEMAEKTDYETQLNSENFLEEDKMLPETKTMLAIIYRDYLADEEEKKQIEEDWIKNDEQYEKLLNEKYDINNIFENKKSKMDEEENVLPIEHKKETWFKRIRNKILNLFKKK